MCMRHPVSDVYKRFYSMYVCVCVFYVHLIWMWHAAYAAIASFLAIVICALSRCMKSQKGEQTPFALLKPTDLSADELVWMAHRFRDTMCLIAIYIWEANNKGDVCIICIIMQYY